MKNPTITQFVLMIVACLSVPVFLFGNVSAQSPSDYAKLKAAGNVTVTKQDADSVIITSRKYDPASGEKLPPEPRTLSITKLQRDRAELVDELAKIDAMISDLKAAQ